MAGASPTKQGISLQFERLPELVEALQRLQDDGGIGEEDDTDEVA